jgi:hypothetical protein
MRGADRVRRALRLRQASRAILVIMDLYNVSTLVRAALRHDAL